MAREKWHEFSGRNLLNCVGRKIPAVLINADQSDFMVCPIESTPDIFYIPHVPRKSCLLIGWKCFYWKIGNQDCNETQGIS